MFRHFLESKRLALVKLRNAEKNCRRVGHLENRLALAHAALRAVRKEKKGSPLRELVISTVKSARRN